ncbi:hypothetical protein SAY87_026071 [Trapa incisa]|uniref:C3H1-type domain-containing protein n=2 Tax=Trapa TaxID=22665 RepID=A0AAN7R4I1_TRANT|nr:hypothetical protein SAY87_026071 [Trapa incisa]KAK4785493.1 hypothetical protein SAY86_002182 [Trapa natans]
MTSRPNPTVQVPPWDLYDDYSVGVYPPHSVPSPTGDYLAAFRRYLPSNEPDTLELGQAADASELLLDDSQCDHFRMYVFKVKRCPRGRSHDWTDCPYAHPGEKARRRDPRRFQYSGTSCPDFRKGVCKRGDSCEFAHGVFECWLHPDRYRTQPCKDGPSCPRRVCFFAHFPEQLRILPPQQQSPASSVESDYCSHQLTTTKPHTHFLSSPTSVLISPPISPPSDSPPVSPNGIHSMSDLVASMKGLSFGESNLISRKPHFASGFGPTSRRPAIYTGTCTNGKVTSSPTQGRLGGYDLWQCPFMEEPAMERVESGRDIRSRIYAKLSKDNPLDGADTPVRS